MQGQEALQVMIAVSKFPEGKLADLLILTEWMKAEEMVIFQNLGSFFLLHLVNM